MGLVELLLGKANPVSQFVAQNRNAIRGAGAGFGSATNIGDGFGAAARGAAVGAPLDDAFATTEKERMAREQQLQTAIANIRDKYQRPDIADMMETGGLDVQSGWNEVLKGRAADKPQFQEVGGKLVRIDGDQVSQAYDPYESTGGMKPQDAFGNEKDLAAQYGQQDPVKTYNAVRNSYERVRQSADMGNKNTDGSGAADLSLIFAYMKMLDPTSVVREGEQASAANAGGVPAQVMNLYNSLMNGGKLTPGVRQQFVQSADAIYKDTAQNLSQTNDQFTTRAGGWGVDPTRFVTQPESYPAFAPPGGAGDVQSLLDKYR